MHSRSLLRSCFPISSMILVGTFVAGLTSNALPALGFEVETATVWLQPRDDRGKGAGDALRFEGQVEELDLDPFPDVAIAFGSFQEIVRSDAVILDEDGNYVYTAPANRAGLSNLKFDPSKGELSFMARRLDLHGLENPETLRLVTASGDTCTRLTFDVHRRSKTASKEIRRFRRNRNSQESCYVAVPDIIGLSIDEAEARLSDLGFVPGDMRSALRSDIAADVIAFQHPPSGTRVTRGTAVDFVVSLGAPADADGVVAAVEDGVPGGGDGNGDGVPDSDQAHVASLPNVEDGRYVTLVSPVDTYLARVVSSSAAPVGPMPGDVAFPLGLFGFEVHLRAPGGSATVTMLLPAGVELSSYHRYGPTPSDPVPHWYEFLFDGETGAELFKDRVVLHLIDGARGDDDLDGTNGIIVDPGGPSAGPSSTEQAFHLTIGQAFRAILPVVGTGPDTWQLSHNGVSDSVLPAGLDLAETSGRWYISGTVAPEAALATYDVVLLGSSTDAVEQVRLLLTVSLPFTVWSQNTILRPEDLIPESLIISTCASALLFPLAGGFACAGLIAKERSYDSEVQNTWADNWDRTQSILPRLPQYDIVGLQEVFSSPLDHERLEWFQDDATEHFVLPGPDASLEDLHGSAGLALLVKYDLAPNLTQTFDLLQHRQQVYALCAEGTGDCHAEKGFTLDRVHIGDGEDHYIWVVNTHTQASEAQAIELTAEVRTLQLQQLKQAMDAIPERDHPVLIMGDFNIDAQEQDPSEYIRMLHILGIDEEDALLPRYGPADAADRLTIDRLRNPYAFYWFWGEPTFQELDHMLVRQGRRFGILVRHIQVTDDVVPTELCRTGDWQFPPNTDPEPTPPDTLTCYLSDHYGVAATLGLFSTAPTIIILRPADGEVLVEGQPVVLHANAGARTDLLSRFRWTSDRAGNIGSGHSTSWLAAVPGPHRITASVTDFDGLVYAASIDVVVEADNDGDGLSNRREGELGTDPDDADTDDDGLNDFQEVGVYNTDPLSADTDGDGLPDGLEIALGSSPLIGDSDQDGIADQEEAALGTNPAAADSDADGVWDGAELVLGTSPQDPSSVPASLPAGALLGADGGFLAVIDPSNGRVGRIGQPAGGFGFSLAADTTDTVFVGDFFEGALLTADPLSAVSTPVAPLQTAAGESVDVLTLAFNPADGFLYGPEEGRPCVPNCPLTGQLLKIDRASAEVTRVGTEGADPIRALTFDATGRLYAIITRDGADRLAELDPGTGGMLQDIGDTGFPAPVFGLAFDASGALLATAPRNQAFQTDLLMLDTGTGIATPKQILNGRVFDLAIGRSGGGGRVLVEDFSDDTNPAIPGYASSVFVHSLPVSAIVDATSFPPPEPFPSPPHALALFITPDHVTFALAPGERILRVSVKSNALYGFGEVEVLGTGDTAIRSVPRSLIWQLLEVRSSDLGDHGIPLGDIQGVTLMGAEVFFDDLEIDVTP